VTVVTRRSFLQTTALLAGALLVGFRLDGRPATAAEALAPNAFIRIAPDNTITIISKHTELGQGSYTGLATILAEEIDADWGQIRVEPAPADAKRYGNRLVGGVQMTGGSTSMAEAWDEMRRAGATARAMLVDAAAREWGVPASEITVDGGVVSHSGSGRRATFGDLASKAAGLTPPSQVTLKDPKDFKLVGKRVPRVDSRPKTDGSAQFTADFTAPGLLTALIARPPRFGATVKSIDATAARRVKGVINVVRVPSGVAVVATGFWAAHKGREALRVTWDESRAERRGTEELYAAYRTLATRSGKPAKRVGDTAGALRGATRSSKPSTSSRTSRTLRWSRSTEWCGSALTASSSGQGLRRPRSTSRSWPRSPASRPTRCASIRCSREAASGGARHRMATSPVKRPPSRRRSATESRSR
jgi:isoquinoline 1-oxidoreductase beta subunit